MISGFGTTEGRCGRHLGWCVAAESQCGLAVVGRIWRRTCSRRRIGNYDASLGCQFRYAQKQAASRCYMGVLVSNPNSNGKIIIDTNGTSRTAIPPTARFP